MPKFTMSASKVMEWAEFEVDAADAEAAENAAINRALHDKDIEWRGWGPYEIHVCVKEVKQTEAAR